MKKAFSLIELSIVILIIGILVAGVTQSSRLVAQFRLSSARNLTKSSPVSSISGLVLWLDATSEGTIADAETEDGAEITDWTEINPQTTAKKVVSQSSSNRPFYDSDGINGLPTINFNGTTDYFYTAPH